jgi:hypothetical protein
MLIKNLILLVWAVASLYLYDSPTATNLITYSDDNSGFSIGYPDTWDFVTDVDTMLGIQDGSIDLIRQEDLTESEKSSYKFMVHVTGSPRYISNVAVLVHPHYRRGDSAYPDSESAIQAVKEDFDRNRESGTFFLEETYLGESHTYVYRRNVNVPAWSDSIRITYYLTANRTDAYMLVETALVSALSDSEVDMLNQVLQSFRVTANETQAIDPSLDWGAFKPGDDGEGTSGTPVDNVDIQENFNDNRNGWPSGDNADITGGKYILDSRDGVPFTVRNTGLGQIGFDFSYEGSVDFLAGDDSAGYGLVFGYRDADNYFAFLITQGGQFLVIEERGGSIQQLIPWTSFDQASNGSHTLQIEGDYQTVNDPTVTHRYDVFFSIDGNPVGDVRISRVLDVSGWFGVFVSADLNVEYDWLTSRNYLPDAVMTLDRYE